MSNEQMHPEVQKYLSERNSRAVKSRWSRTTKAERVKISQEMLVARKKKQADKTKLLEKIIKDTQ